MEPFFKLRLFFKNHVVQHLSRRLFVVLFFGQVLSLLVCTLGTTSQKLVTDCNTKVPAFQGFLGYCLLTAVFTTKFAYNWREFLKVLKQRWWKYVLIACIDVEANFMIYKAYQYTSITSVQILSCLAIPTVVILSVIVLKAKYKVIHYLGIFICLSGMGFLVWADIYGSRNQGPTSDDHHSEIIGDILVVCGAILYGASNIAEEFVVKTASITEFLGMMSFFAIFFSAANVIALEKHALDGIVWDYEVLLLLSVNAVVMFSFYILMPVLICRSSATLVNLTLLTADLYSLFVGLYLFNFTFSNLYIIAFIIIVIGVVIFKVFPTPSRIDGVLITESPINVYDDEQQILHESGE